MRILNRSQHINEYTAVFAVSLVYFVMGLVFGTLSPSLVIFEKSGYNQINPISSTVSSWILNCLNVGIIPGAICASYTNEILGRKYSIIISILPQLIADIVLIFAANVYMLYLSWLLRGVCVAWIYSVIPTYVSEIATPDLRGPSTVFCILLLPIGSLIGGMMQAVLSIDLTAIICGVFALIILPLLFTIPETPYFYVSKNKYEESKMVLRKLRLSHDIEKEFEEIERAWTESQQLKDDSWVKLFTDKLNRKVLFICVGIMTVQQFCGYIPIMAYSHGMIFDSGLGLSLLTISILVNVVSITLTIISILVINSWGRRPLFIVISSVITLCLIVTGFTYYFDDQFNTEKSMVIGIIKLISILGFIAAVGLGMGHLPNVMAAELFSTDIKSKGSSTMLIVQSIEGTIVTLAFDSLTSVHDYLPFWIMAVTTFLGVIFGILFVPETKNKSLAEIQTKLNEKPKLNS